MTLLEKLRRDFSGYKIDIKEVDGNKKLLIDDKETFIEWRKIDDALIQKRSSKNVNDAIYQSIYECVENFLKIVEKE